MATPDHHLGQLLQWGGLPTLGPPAGSQAYSKARVDWSMEQAGGCRKMHRKGSPLSWADTLLSSGKLYSTQWAPLVKPL